MNNEFLDANNEFIITSIKITDKYVTIKIVENNDYEVCFKIRIDDYLKLNYQKNDTISQDQYDELQLIHTYCYAFNKCIRKLTASDKTESEIRNMLSKIDGLKIEDTQRIIDELKSLGLICDYNTAQTQLYIDQQKFVGKNKSVFNMKKRGISQEIVEELIDGVDDEQEIERGTNKIVLFAKSIKNKSYRETINALRNKLYMDGFENIDQIISNAHIEKDDKHEQQQLETLVEKTINKYNKKYQGYNLYSHVYKYLLSKGFEREDITIALQEKELFNED